MDGREYNYVFEKEKKSAWTNAMVGILSGTEADDSLVPPLSEETWGTLLVGHALATNNVGIGTGLVDEALKESTGALLVVDLTISKHV